MMSFIATVATDSEKYHAHLEVSDDDAGRAKVAEALSDIQRRFVPHTEQKKQLPATPRSATPRSPQPTGGEANRGS